MNHLPPGLWLPYKWHFNFFRNSLTHSQTKAHHGVNNTSCELFASVVDTGSKFTSSGYMFPDIFNFIIGKTVLSILKWMSRRIWHFLLWFLLFYRLRVRPFLFKCISVDCNIQISTIYAPMTYTAPCVMLLMRAASITWASGRGLGPGYREFFGPCEMASARGKIIHPEVKKFMTLSL